MVDIRRIKTEDTASVKSLIDRIMSGEFSDVAKVYEYDDLDDIASHYGGERDIFLVAEKDGKIVGTVAIKEDGKDTALLRRIFLDKDYRGKGYGEKLISKAMEFCFLMNYRNVVFRGTDRMQNALRLCLKNGFRQESVAELGSFKLIELARTL